MISIILIALIFTVILNFNKMPQVLSCGIFGFYGDLEKFNWDKFNILGLGNESRGRDAVGIATNNRIVKEVDMTYSEYLKKFKPLQLAGDETFILGHVRTTSAGLSNNDGVAFAQPLIENNSLLAHNGTIYNQEDLIEKGGLSKLFKHENEELLANDSMILHRIINSGKYELLKDYEGSAAFSYYDNAKDELILFSGSSLMYGNYSVEERPMKVLYGDGYMWFSSVENPLWYISEGEVEIGALEHNKLHFFKGAKLVNEIEIDRSASKQIKTVVHTNYATQNYNRASSLPVVVNKGVVKNEKKDQPKNKIEFDGEFFYLNGERAHGVYHVDTLGYIHPRSMGGVDTMPWDVTAKYYFIHGYMIQDKDVVIEDDSSVYTEAHTSFNKWVREVGKKNKSMRGVKMMQFARECCDYPIMHLNIIFDIERQSGHLKYTGTIDLPFTDYIYNVIAGKVVSKTKEGKRPVYHIPEDNSLEDEMLEKSPFTDEPFTEAYDSEFTPDSFYDDESANEELVENEIKKIIQELLDAVRDTASELTIYSDSTKGRMALELTEEIESAISMKL